MGKTRTAAVGLGITLAAALGVLGPGTAAAGATSAASAAATDVTVVARGLDAPYGLQFFGTLDVDARTRALTAALHDVAGRRLWSIDLAPYGA